MVADRTQAGSKSSVSTGPRSMFLATASVRAPFGLPRLLFFSESGCCTQAGYRFRKVNQLLEITLDQRADKFRCTDAVLLGQTLYFVPDLLWSFDPHPPFNRPRFAST